MWPSRLMYVFFSSRRRHTRCALVTGVQTCALPICPSGPATRGLLDARRLARLPHGAIVTNISRGDIIDDTALVAALESGAVAAAGLDVFAGEPDIHPAYRTMPNVFGLPHIGSSTTATRIAMGKLLCAALSAHHAGQATTNRVC